MSPIHIQIRGLICNISPAAVLLCLPNSPLQQMPNSALLDSRFVEMPGLFESTVTSRQLNGVAALAGVKEHF